MNSHEIRVLEKLLAIYDAMNKDSRKLRELQNECSNTTDMAEQAAAKFAIKMIQLEMPEKRETFTSTMEALRTLVREAKEAPPPGPYY